MATRSSWSRSSWRSCSTRMRRDEGRGAVTRAHTARSRRRGTGVVEIIDQGHGIRPSRADQDLRAVLHDKPPGRGTGLGLSICYAIVSDHGGRIEVDSAPGKGSDVSHPASRATKESAGMSDRVPDPRARSPRTRSTSATLLEHFLHGRGHQVTTRARRPCGARGDARRGVRRRAARHRDAGARRARGRCASVREEPSPPEVIIITGNGTVETAISADEARRLRLPVEAVSDGRDRRAREAGVGEAPARARERASPGASVAGRRRAGDRHAVRADARRAGAASSASRRAIRPCSSPGNRERARSSLRARSIACPAAANGRSSTPTARRSPRALLET